MTTTSTHALRVAIYSRVSTDEQKEGHTIDSQVKGLETLAETNGWFVVLRYLDEGWSGALLNRPALDKLRDDAAGRLFDAVLIHDVDRLSRDLLNLAVLKRDLERHGVRLIFKNLPTDDGPLSQFMVNILGSYAELERIMLMDRFRRGKRFKAEERKVVVGNKPPYGYGYVKKDKEAGREGYYTIDQEETAVVRLMFQWVAEEHLSEGAVLRRMIQLKIPARHTRWSKATVHRILTDEIYTGVTYYNKTSRVEATRRDRARTYRKTTRTSHRRRPRSEWIPIPLPPELHIIDRVRFDRVQQQLRKNGAFSPRNTKHFYLLRQVRRVCGACGASFMGSPSNGRTYYRCSNFYALPDRSACKAAWIRGDRVEKAVWEELRKRLQDPALILNNVRQLRAQRHVQRNALEDNAMHAREQLKTCQEEEDRLVVAYRRGLISLSQFEREVTKVRAAKTLAEQTIAAASSGTSSSPSQQSERTLREYCALLLQRLETLQPSERQELLGYLLTEIVFHTSRIGGDHVTVRGRLPVPEDGREAATSALGSTLRPDRNISDIVPGSHSRPERNASVPFQFELTVLSRRRTRRAIHSTSRIVGQT